MTEFMIFKGELLHNSLLKFVSRDRSLVKVNLIAGDKLEIYNNDYGQVSRIFVNDKDIEYMEEYTPLESIVDACEEI